MRVLSKDIDEQYNAMKKLVNEEKEQTEDVYLTSLTKK